MAQYQGERAEMEQRAESITEANKQYAKTLAHVQGVLSTSFDSGGMNLSAISTASKSANVDRGIDHEMNLSAISTASNASSTGIGGSAPIPDLSMDTVE